MRLSTYWPYCYYSLGDNAVLVAGNGKQQRRMLDKDVGLDPRWCCCVLAAKLLNHRQGGVLRRCAITSLQGMWTGLFAATPHSTCLTSCMTGKRLVLHLC